MKIKILVLSSIVFIISACSSAPGGGTSGGGSSSSTGSVLTNYYVATNGSDANTGLTKTDPLLSIQRAVDLAVSSNFTATIYVQEGYYTTNAGLTNTAVGIILNSNNNFRFYGGCDTNFDLLNGHVSVLDGRNVLDKLFFIQNSTNIVLNGFLFLRGNAVANNWGGAILFWNVNNSVITNCAFLTNNGFNGGAVCLSNSGTNVISALFANNTAGNGGGIYIYGASHANSIYSAFSNNTASAGGGAIRFFGGGNNTVITGVFYGNKTTGGNRGGAISINVESGTIIRDSVFISNTAEGTSSYDGAIASWGPQTLILNSVISNNVCGTYGGGVHFSGSGSVLSNCVVFGNSVTNASAVCKGGGVIMQGSGIIIRSCMIRSNFTPMDNDLGGGIFNGGNSNQVLFCEISNNSSYFGGGIASSNTVATTVSNCTVTANYATNGGGIALLHSDGTIILNTIFGNSCPSPSMGYGGGVLLYYASPLIRINNISSNYAGAAGGGLFAQSSSPLVQNNFISTNFGGSWGDGAFYMDSGATNTANTILNNNFGSIGFYNCLSGLIFQSNLIGGDSEGMTSFGGNSGYSFRENLFVTNQMTLLFRNHSPVTNIYSTNWTDVNNTNITLAEPGSTNNKATNL